MSLAALNTDAGKLAENCRLDGTTAAEAARDSYLSQQVCY